MKSMVKRKSINLLTNIAYNLQQYQNELSQNDYKSEITSNSDLSQSTNTNEKAGNKFTMAVNQQKKIAAREEAQRKDSRQQYKNLVYDKTPRNF